MFKLKIRLKIMLYPKSWFQSYIVKIYDECYTRLLDPPATQLCHFHEIACTVRHFWEGLLFAHLLQDPPQHFDDADTDLFAMPACLKQDFL